jgi:hypothetical protein
MVATPEKVSQLECYCHYRQELDLTEWERHHMKNKPGAILSMKRLTPGLPTPALRAWTLKKTNLKNGPDTMPDDL